MNDLVKADASPEKRLFISLITRDIPLSAAFLDLIDNSINSAVEPYAEKLKTAADYQNVLEDTNINPNTDIEISINDEEVLIEDNAVGISWEIAKEHVFKFGRPAGPGHENDRLSVYGIGLKRAIFKLGNRIKIISDHVDGGFELDLNVSEWEKDTTQPWQIEIKKRKPSIDKETGTKIRVHDLYKQVKNRINDGIFIEDLKTLVAETYAFYTAKFVNIYINEIKVDGAALEVGENYNSDIIEFDEVSCSITAGIGIPESGNFREKSSGWFVFCNGRAVISADKSQLTGWGETSNLPIFQPKHRPFLGIVFFVSQDSEKLPWSTTKSAIDVDNSIWQIARQHMTAIGRVVIKFLDNRYSDEGTAVESKELQSAAGKKIGMIAAATSEKREFAAPKRSKNESIRIQYDAKKSDVDAIANYLGDSNVGGAEIGRHTFFYFLRNEVYEEE